jgi:hypothetical protein
VITYAWDLLPSNAERALAQLASGLLSYTDYAYQLPKTEAPYPFELHLAMDHITRLAGQQGVSPPTSIGELVELASLPFGYWGIRLAGTGIDSEESLLHYGRPSPTCEELSALRGDLPGEIRDHPLVCTVIDRARELDLPDAYVAFRQLLVKFPTIAMPALEQQLDNSNLAPLSDLLWQAYVPIPPDLIRDGQVHVCGSCRSALLPAEGSNWICVDPYCPAPYIPEVLRPECDRMLWQRRELRAFLSGPGRAELRIADSLSRLNVPVTLWPSYGDWSLSAFTEGPWFAAIRGWQHPVRLARELNQNLPALPTEATGAFVVITKEQVRAWPKYIERLRRSYPALKPGHPIQAVSESRFMQLIREQIMLGR